MIWQNAWALAGGLLLALPVLIHLLSRKRAVLQKFPSLRFLDVTRLLPTRSPNLSDIPLLLVRLGVLAAAIVALAQPLLMSAGRKQELNTSLARAIVVDTSRSMARTVGGAKTIADSALVLADQLSGEASASVILQTATVSSVMDGARAWLAMQPGRAELVVISDFQTGTIDSATVVPVPANVGVRLVRVEGREAVSEASWQTTTATVTATRQSGRTDAEWTDRNGDGQGVTLLELFTLAADAPGVRAAHDAADRITSPGIPDSLRPVGIVFRRAAEEAALVTDARAPDVAWMAHVLLAVRDNELLASSAAAEDVSDTTIAAPFAVITSDSHGAPVVYAAQSTVSGTKRLLFFLRGSPSGLTAASLIAAVAGAVALPSTIAESELTSLS
ncbi:MAG: BatA domain-containing protein, partial [Gemmatimonadaceae bacterium]